MSKIIIRKVYLLRIKTDSNEYKNLSIWNNKHLLDLYLSRVDKFIEYTEIEGEMCKVIKDPYTSSYQILDKNDVLDTVELNLYPAQISVSGSCGELD